MAIKWQNWDINAATAENIMEITEKMSIVKSKSEINLSLRSTDRMHSCEHILRYGEGNIG